MIDVVAIMDDGSVEQYRVVLPPNPEALAARDAVSAARDAFMAEMRALMERHGVRLTGSGWEYQASNLMFVSVDWEMSVEEACDD